MCSKIRKPSLTSVELLEELRKADTVYRKASPEQFYLAIRRYTDVLQRFNVETVRRRRHGSRRTP